MSTVNDATVQEIVDDMRLTLGAKLVAYIAGVSETRTVREWAEGARRPTLAAEDRLRLAHRIMTLIRQSEGQAIALTWFQGMNPQLGNRSPARVLHEDSFDEASARVLAAANAFAGSTDRQPSAVERIISRRFAPSQINAPTVTPTSFPELVTRLREILGVRLVAYIGGVQSARTVSTWAEGTGIPGEVYRDRLRHAYHVAALLREQYDATTVQSWFQGMNPSLDDESPANVLRTGDPVQSASDVLAAARAFANVG